MGSRSGPQLLQQPAAFGDIKGQAEGAGQHLVPDPYARHALPFDGEDPLFLQDVHFAGVGIMQGYAQRQRARQGHGAHQRQLSSGQPVQTPQHRFGNTSGGCRLVRFQTQTCPLWLTRPLSR